MPQTTSRKYKGIDKYDKYDRYDRYDRYDKKYDRYDRYDEKDRSRDYKMGGNALFRKVGGTRKHRRGGSKRSRTHRKV